MAYYPSVQALAMSYLRSGISAREARNIVDFVLSGRGEPTTRQQQQLERISNELRDAFTKDGAAEWLRLTGSQPSMSPAGRVHLDLTAPSLFDEVLARKERPVQRVRLSPDEALNLRVPKALLLRAAQDPASHATAKLFEQLQSVERTLGDNDGILTPRNMTNAPENLRSVMNDVWAKLGKKALSLSAIRTALPEALVEELLGGKAQSNRTQTPLNGFFRELSEDSVYLLSREYEEEVVEKGGSHTLFLEKAGFVTPTEKARVVALIHRSNSPPSLEQIASLFRLATEGQTVSRDFYNATQLSEAALQQLEVRRPTLFVRAQRLIAKATAPASIRRDTVDVPRLAQAWRAEVISGELGIEAFAAAHQLQTSVLRKLRRDHPKLFPLPSEPGRSPLDEAMATALAAALNVEVEKHPFDKVSALLDRINAGSEFTKRYGHMSYGRYYEVRKGNKTPFNRVDSSARWMNPVRAEVERQMSAPEPPQTRDELIDRLQRRWPEMTYSRLAHLKEAFPNLDIPGKYHRRSKSELDLIADRLVVLLQQNPDATYQELSDNLGTRFGDVAPADVGEIVRNFRADRFRGVDKIHRLHFLQRHGDLVARRLYELVVESVPPGTPNPERLRIFNRLLEKRGVPAYSKTDAARVASTLPLTHDAQPAARDARVLAEIVAEYATAARRGESADAIWEQVLKDYPSISARHLGRYRASWRHHPEEYPALAPFLSADGELSLRGLGEQSKRPRYLGGWDPERYVLLADSSEQRRLAELSEYASIPLRLPEIDAVVDDLHGSRPLFGANVLWISHLLADVVPMGYALKDAGALTSRTVVVSSPYGANPAVRSALQDLGFSVNVPKLDSEAYRAAVEKALIEVVRLHEENGQPIVVLDDGGLSSELVGTDSRFAAVRRITEQTTGGIILGEENELQPAVVNVARSKSKEHEGEWVGKAIAGRILQRTKAGMLRLRHKRVVVIGYGVVGQALSEELTREDARVTVIETSPEAIAAAEAAGITAISAYDLKARAKALRRTDWLIAATGKPSVSTEDLLSLKNGAVAASASSRRYELNIEGLEQIAHREELPRDNPLTRSPTARYTVRGKTITIVGDGWPVNFDGSVVDLPPEEVQLTDAAMLAGAFQAARLRGHVHGLVPLDPLVDDRLLQRHLALAPSFPPLRLYDVQDWPHVYRDMAQMVSAVASDAPARANVAAANP